jgi:hypothetical protein
MGILDSNKAADDFERWVIKKNQAKIDTDMEAFAKKLEELMNEKEQQAVPVKALPPNANQQVFSVERVNNGFVVKVVSKGTWVSETPEGLIDAIKMALADARLV